MKTIRALRYWAVALVAATVLVWMAGRAWGLGVYLRETKEELKLKYDVVVHDHGDERLTVEFTLADEGRLKPLDEVQLHIRAKEPNPGGGYSVDVVTIDLVAGKGGRRVGRVEVLKALTERAQIVLNTHTLDGKKDPETRLHHAVPIRKYIQAAPAAAPPAAKPDPAPPAPAPPATQPKK